MFSPKKKNDLSELSELAELQHSSREVIGLGSRPAVTGAFLSAGMSVLALS